MDKNAYKLIKAKFESIEANIADGMLMVKRRPHTAPVEHLTVCGEGRQTGAYYFLARYFDLIDNDAAESIAKEIIKLQNTDEDSVFYGCMRWYREEPYISDTNGAFFVMLPFALAYYLFEEKLTPVEKESISLMLSRGADWFSRQSRGSLYYTNKVTSDGAILALISNISGKFSDECEAFWNEWLGYVDEHGYGWGENTSDVYSMITLTALSIAAIAVKGDLGERIKKKRRELLEYIAFHGDRDIIPSVRTYNFAAEATYGGSVYKAIIKPNELPQLSDLLSAVAIQLAIEDDEVELFKNENYGVRCERIYDSSYAYTYKAESLRLGSISHFPPMPGCYQNKKWGLGWQTMPVSAMIGDEYVAFLRLSVIHEGVKRTHPARDKHSAHLMSRLFTDNNPPSYMIRTSQEKNKLVAARKISSIANSAGYIADGWCMPGERNVEMRSVNGNDWYVVDGRIAVCPLRGVGASDEERVKPKVTVKTEDGFTSIEYILYEGDDTLIFKDYIESAWAIIAIDELTDLDSVVLTDEDVADRKVPRMPYMKKRRITLSDNDGATALDFEPYETLM